MDLQRKNNKNGAPKQGAKERLAEEMKELQRKFAQLSVESKPKRQQDPPPAKKATAMVEPKRKQKPKHHHVVRAIMKFLREAPVESELKSEDDGDELELGSRVVSWEDDDDPEAVKTRRGIVAKAQGPLHSVLSLLSGGQMASYVNNDPSVAAGWSNAAALFNQFRVVSYRVTLVPFSDVNIVNLNNQGMATYIDEDDATSAPASYAVAATHADTLEIHDGYKIVHRRATPVYDVATNPDDTWNDTASPPTGTQAIKFIANAAPISTVSWSLWAQWEIEFRGLGA